MSRRSRPHIASAVLNLMKSLFGPTAKSRPGKRRRGFGFETLEGRAMMATDFGAITGILYRDTTGNGFTAGEQISGATVNLYTDDGDGLFEPGTGDALTNTDTTDVGGAYRFDGVVAGSYWIQQPSQTVGGVLLSAQNSSLIAISALEAQGSAGTTIDPFTAANPTVTAAFPVGTTDQAFAATAGTLGGERDLFVELTAAAAGGDQVTLSGTATGLTWNADLNTQGRYVDVFDGADGDAGVIDFTGLGGVDLTTGGATAFRMLAGADQAGATARLRVYTDATNWSEQTVTIPNAASGELIFQISAFTTGGGAAGPATFSNVGAIELQVDTTVNGTDGAITFLGMLGPTVKTQDFANTADLSITKTVDDSTPTVGQNVVYNITLSNAGPGAGNNIVVTDLLPAGLTHVSNTPSAGTSYNSGTGIWTVPSLDSGANATLAITATVTALGLNTNTAEVTDADEFDPDSTPNNQVGTEDDQASVNVTATQIDLSLSKTVNSATPNVGQNVTFTLTATNAGPDAATGVTVSDLLPAGLTFVSATPSGTTTYNSGTGIWTIGNLASGAGNAATLSIIATVTSSGAKFNTAQVAAANEGDLDSTPGNSAPAEDDQASVTVTPQIADLSLTKTVDNATPNANQNVTFTITLTNGGPDNATGVVVTDLLPAGLTFVSATPSGTTTYNSGTGVWTVGALNSAASATLSVVATATTVGAKVNTAQVTAVDQFDSDSTPNNGIGTEDDQASVTVTPAVADLSLTKTVNNATPNANQNVTFTITVTNGGAANATGVVVTDLLPAGLTFVSATPSQGTYNNTTGVWTIGAINSAANVTLSVVATATTQGAKVNTAQVTAADQFDSDSTPNNSVGTEDDQASVTVTPAIADLSLTKTVNNATPSANQNVTFTITLTNGGTATATNVAVTDQLPAGTTFVSATPSQGTYNNTTGVWTVGTVNSAGIVTLQITATVTTVGAKVNTAQVTASDQFDSDSTPNNSVGTEDDQASVTVTPTAADLRVLKTVSSAAPQINSNFTYTVTVTNEGTTGATGVQLTDVIPTGLTFVSATPSGSTTYNSATGLWNVGSLNAGASATLSIVVSGSTVGTFTNTAQVTAMTEFDSDSTPNNGVATEDDQSSVSVSVSQQISPRLCKEVWTALPRNP